MFLGEELFKGIEAVVPELLVMLEPSTGLGKRFEVESTRVRPTVNRAPDDPSRFEGLHMLRRRRQRHVEWFRQFSHRAFTIRQTAYHRPPRRISQRAEDVIEGIGLLNHTVKLPHDQSLVNLLVELRLRMSETERDRSNGPLPA